MKMLVVDDSKAMREFLCHIAQDLAFSTQTAEDGRAGLEFFLKCDPREMVDVALVDWEMPRMNGLELVELLRKNHDYDNVKIMMVTTLNSESNVARALEAGANDFLMKPVTKESLEEKLMILGLVA